MEATDVAEQIRELQAERAAERAATAQKERFRGRAALTIAVMAMLLAINALGGEDAANEIINNNILASDTWAFYQAKNIRQTSNQLAADELELILPLLAPDKQAEAQRRIERYKGTVARYESEPDKDEPANVLKGEGKKELFARARHYEGKRDRAQQQDPYFDFAGALFQIAIVIGSVAVLSTSRPVLGLSLALGVVATFLMLNGYFLWFDILGERVAGVGS